MDEAKFISAMVPSTDGNTGMAGSGLQWLVLQLDKFGVIVVPITMPDINFRSCLCSGTKSKNETTSLLPKKLLDFGELEICSRQGRSLTLPERIQVVSGRILKKDPAMSKTNEGLKSLTAFTRTGLLKDYLFGLL